MKKILPLFCGVLLLYSGVLAQHTFNKQYYFDGIAAVGNGIHVTDSCYYISGLVVDTINGGIYDGLMFGKLDLQGELEEYTLFLDSIYDFENWRTPLVFIDSSFISVGLGVDSVGYGYWLKLNDSFEITAERYFRSYYHPDRNFIVPVDFFIHQNKDSYIATTTSFQESSGVININIAVLRSNEDGEEIWYIPYGGNWVEEPSCMAYINDSLIIIGAEIGNYNLTNFDLIIQSHLIAIDTSGQIQWTWTSPHEVEQGVNDIIAEEDGGLIIASGRGFLEDVNPTTQYIFWDRGLIFKLDENRELEWECEFTEPGPTFENRLNRIVKSTDQTGYVSAGQMRVWLNEDNASLLGWLAKVTPEGDSLWSRKLFYYELPDSIEYEHHIHDLQTTPDGGYFMSGYTFNREELQEPPRQRAWFIKVDSEGCLIPGCGLVDAEEPTAEGPPLLLYPNPAAEHLNVYLGDNGGQQWHFLLFDAAGRQLGSYIAPTPHTTYMLPVHDYPVGTYYLQVLDQSRRGQKTYTWIKGR